MTSRNNIQVSVKSAYIAEQSDPDANRYVFSYTVTITNSGELPARLVARHWVITDAAEKVQEVRGLGVIGQHPHLDPGESFTYTSGAVLETPIGHMHGAYQMVADDGTHFDADIPAFNLATPHSLH